MARSDLLINLVKASANGDRQMLHRTVEAIVAEERAKQHNVLAERLELKPARSQSVVIAGGRRDLWPIAEARLALNGAEITTPCFIASEGPPLLGAVTLESLFLAVDPVGKRLIPVDGFVG